MSWASPTISGHDCLSGVKSGSKMLEQEPWGSCFPPGCDSSLCFGFGYGQGLRAWGCTSMLVSLFYLVCIPSLFYFRGWVRPGCIGFTAASDVRLHPRASFTPSTCVQGYVPWWGLPLPWSEARLRSKLTLFPLIDNGSLALVESSSGSRGAEEGARYGLEDAPGWSWQVCQRLRQFFICCLHAVTRSEQIYVCALQELCLGFLQVLFKPAKGLIFLVLNSGLGCLIWGANPSLPREHFSTNDIPSSSGFLIRGELLLSSYQIPPGPLYIGLVVEEMSC